MHILVIEDDAATFRSYRRVLLADEKREHWQLSNAKSVKAARRLLSEHGQAIDVVLLDLWLPDGLGVDLLGDIESACPGAAVMVVSGDYGSEHAVKLMGRCDVVIRKPINAAALVAALERLGSDPGYLTHFIKEHALSATEAQVLRLALDGKPNSEIARAMEVTPATVRRYWTRLLERANFDSQRALLAHLVKLAARA